MKTIHASLFAIFSITVATLFNPYIARGATACKQGCLVARFHAIVICSEHHAICKRKAHNCTKKELDCMREKNDCLKQAQTNLQVCHPGCKPPSET